MSVGSLSLPEPPWASLCSFIFYDHKPSATFSVEPLDIFLGLLSNLSSQIKTLKSPLFFINVNLFQRIYFNTLLSTKLWMFFKVYCHFGEIKPTNLDISKLFTSISAVRKVETCSKPWPWHSRSLHLISVKLHFPAFSRRSMLPHLVQHFVAFNFFPGGMFFFL